MRILVIEDERKVADALERGLCADGYQVTLAATGEEGFFLLSAETFDLIILDLMLPARGGLEILSAMRGQGLQTPVLILTARDGVEDKVQGLDRGADDYLVKPFAFPELLARVRALLRRGVVAEDALVLTTSDLEMQLAQRKVSRAGEPIQLTAREFDLLAYLLRHKGRVVSREMIARDVWQEPNRAIPLDNVIDVHIARLRKKIDDPFPTRLLKTIRGVGFTVEEESQ